LTPDAGGELDRFRDWLDNNQEFKTLMLSHQTDNVPLENTYEGKYKCYDFRCKHYAYGFETEEALKHHIGLHENAAARRAAQQGGAVVPGSAKIGSDGRTPLSEEKEAGYDSASSDEERSRPEVAYRKGSALPSGSGPFEEHRRSLLPSPRYESPIVFKPRNMGPCLRCKILKKKVST
jgi:hypothetical protein